MLALVTSHSTNNLDVYNASLPNHTEYCRRHGYTLINNDEPYNPYTDVDFILKLFKTYDTVVTMGCDVLIQHLDKPLTDFVSRVISFGTQHNSGELNADLLVYNRSPETTALLEKIKATQHSFVDGQQCLRQLYRDGQSGMKIIPMLQIAYPPMNTHVSYKGVNTRDYFAMHFMCYKYPSSPLYKFDNMREYLSLHANNGFVRKCNIALVTFDNRPLLDWVQLSNQTKQHYCDLYGFDFVFSSKPYYTDRKPNWNKLPLLRDTLLTDKYDYVLWMDSDAAIANPLFDVTMLFDDHDIYFNKDCYGLNSGVFALRNSSIALKFLEESMSDELREKYKKSRWQDQSTMGPLLEGKYKEFAKMIPARVWNSYDNAYDHSIDNEYHEGDFVLHLPDARSLNKRAPNYRTLRFKTLVNKL